MTIPPHEAVTPRQGSALATKRCDATCQSARNYLKRAVNFIHSNVMNHCNTTDMLLASITLLSSKRPLHTMAAHRNTHHWIWCNSNSPTYGLGTFSQTIHHMLTPHAARFLFYTLVNVRHKTAGKDALCKSLPSSNSSILSFAK